MVWGSPLVQSSHEEPEVEEQEKEEKWMVKEDEGVEKGHQGRVRRRRRPSVSPTSLLPWARQVGGTNSNSPPSLHRCG